MKRILFSVLIFSFFATNAFANRITDAADIWFNKSVGRVFMGYATADINVNGSVVDIAKEERPEIKSKCKDALMVGVENFCDVGCGNFKVGVNVSGLFSVPHEIDQKTSQGKKIGGNFSSVLFPAMIGASYNRNISEKFSLNGRLFLGYGTALFSSRTYVIEKDKDGVEHKNYYKHIFKDGICFVSDLSVGVGYALTKKYKLGLDVGYRFTPKTTISEDIKLDFSGFTATLSCTFNL
ncbi:MAG: hypothetical protein LBU29_02025 [Endomicrobium sp.]|nr:hypothetical protein [Endomicrobium sp.]